MKLKTFTNSTLAVNYLGSTIEPIKLKFPKYEKTYTESQKLAYYLTSMLSIDVRDSFELFSEKDLIDKKMLEKFLEMSGNDFDYIWNIAKEKDKTDHINKDFIYLTEFLDRLTKASLSDYQMSVDADLYEILRCIYSIHLLMKANEYHANSDGRYVLEKWKKFFSEKETLLQSKFMEKYVLVSNNRTFDFNKHDNFFHKLVRSNYKTFTELIGI